MTHAPPQLQDQRHVSPPGLRPSEACAGPHTYPSPPHPQAGGQTLPPQTGWAISADPPDTGQHRQPGPVTVTATSPSSHCACLRAATYSQVTAMDTGTHAQRPLSVELSFPSAGSRLHICATHSTQHATDTYVIARHHNTHAMQIQHMYTQSSHVTICVPLSHILHTHNTHEHRYATHHNMHVQQTIYMCNTCIHIYNTAQAYAAVMPQYVCTTCYADTCHIHINKCYTDIPDTYSPDTHHMCTTPHRHISYAHNIHACITYRNTLYCDIQYTYHAAYHTKTYQTETPHVTRMPHIP